MGTFLKQPKQPKKRESKPPATPDAQSVAESIKHFASIFSTYVTDARSGGHNDYGEIAMQLEGIHKSLWSYNMNATNGDNSLSLSTDEHSDPLRLALEGDAVDSIADSLKRIADAMTACAKG